MASSDVASKPRVPKEARAASTTRSRVPTGLDGRSRAGTGLRCGEMSDMTKSLRLGLIGAGAFLVTLLAPHAEAAPPAAHQTIAAVQANEASNWSGSNPGIPEAGKS